MFINKLPHKKFKLPKVSIITVCLNASETINQAIESVIIQGYPNTEYIIIDGGSTDGTIEAIKQYENYIKELIIEPDKGIYDAMNKGIQIANGSLIGIINADDYYERNSINSVVNIFNQNQDVDVIHGDVIFRDEGNNILDTKKPNIKYSQLLKDMILFHPTCFISKEAYVKWGKYNLSYGIAADYELLLRFYLKGAKFYYTNKVLANMREGGISYKNYKYSYLEARKVQIFYGLPPYKATYLFYLKIVKRYLRDLLNDIGLGWIVSLRRKLRKYVRSIR